MVTIQFIKYYYDDNRDKLNIVTVLNSANMNLHFVAQRFTKIGTVTNFNVILSIMAKMQSKIYYFSVQLAKCWPNR